MVAEATAEIDSDDGLITRREVASGSWRARAMAKRTKAIRQARRSAGHFVEYAIPHELTGKRITNAPHHWDWHRKLDQSRFTVLIAAVEHGKTSQIGVGRSVWMVGTNPEGRGAIISNTSRQAEKVLGAIQTHILENPRVREVFPHLRPSTRQQDPWHSTAITVERKTIAKDPTIQALGIGGPLVGSRLDWVVLDDVLDFENTRTPEQLAKLVDWFDSTLWTRLTENAVCWVIGTPWHPKDLLHVLKNRPDWVSATYSAVQNPDAPATDWVTIWPEAFSLERLRTIQRNMTARNFGRKYLCRVRLDSTARFQQGWIDRCRANGRGWSLLPYAPKNTNGSPMPCFTGVDVGVGEDEHHDMSVLFTIAINPRALRVVVEIQAGHWSAPELIRRMWDVHQRYGSIIMVESNGAQRFLLQWPGANRMKIRAFNTTAQNKYDEAFGIESLAVEFRNGMWLIPSGPLGTRVDPEVEIWETEALFYQPGKHTGDRLMASWFAREAARDALASIMQDMDTQTR